MWPSHRKVQSVEIDVELITGSGVGSGGRLTSILCVVRANGDATSTNRSLCSTSTIAC